MDDLFGNLFASEQKQTKPLADRMRPERLSDFVGQESAVGVGSPLRRMIERDALQSVLFYGPPGTGKTTLAQVIAHVTGEKFVSINAVSSGVPELRKLIAKAQDDRRAGMGRTIVFIDEIHRFNKAQQDVLLPYVENGTIVLIGATTENPFFEINSPLLSRMKVVRLEKLQPPQIVQILERAIADVERGFGGSFAAEPEALKIIADFAAGDARGALNILEQAEFMLPENGERVLTVETLRSVIGTALQRYDKKGDQHYDIISAFIKSMRGSDLSRVVSSSVLPRMSVLLIRRHWWWRTRRRRPLTLWAGRRRRFRWLRRCATSPTRQRAMLLIWALRTRVLMCVIKIAAACLSICVMRIIRELPSWGMGWIISIRIISPAAGWSSNICLTSWWGQGILCPVATARIMVEEIKLI